MTKQKQVYPIIYPSSNRAYHSYNCYLYEHDGQLTLIDAGIQTQEFKSYFDSQLQAHGFSVKDIDAIYLTHHHDDHTGMVNAIIEQKDVPVFAHHLAIERVQYEEMYLHRKYEFFDKLYTAYGCRELAANRFTTMKQTIAHREELKLQTTVQPVGIGEKLGNFLIVGAAGHSPDSIIFYDEERQWQFAGDLVLKRASTNALIDFDEKLQLLPTIQQYEQSLVRASQLPTKQLFAGHDDVITEHDVVIAQKLARLQMKRERLLATIQAGHHTAAEIARAQYGNKFEHLFSLILSEVIGLLFDAELRGEVQKEKRNGYWYFLVPN